MVPRLVACAASTLLCGVLDGSRTRPGRLREVARTRSSVHYETGREDVPVLCVCVPAAVRLPASIVASALPTGDLTTRDGALSNAGTTWRVSRWWQPPRPRGLVPPPASALPWPVAVPDDVRPIDLVGSGPGLTPSGDDVVAGVLVAAAAVAHPRLGDWRAETRDALQVRRTTAVSRGLLHHAIDGCATRALAEFVSAVCAGDATRETERLLRVGHSSGAALAAGALHALASHPSAQRAAA